MKTRILLAAIVALLFAIPSWADVSVRNVTAVQRYPWNGLVDIDYEVVCDDADADVYVFPEGTDNDTGALLQLKTLTGEGANGAVKPGTHRMTWDAAKDQPNFHSTSFSVKMTAISGAAPYIVIDLSGGADAASYPVRFSAAGPNLDDDTCRTTELWLRLILPGTFTMGSPETELGHNLGSSCETQHEVTITAPFYLGVLETTYQQYELVMGTNAYLSLGQQYNYSSVPYPYGISPVSGVSYNMLRGSVLGAAWPMHRQVDADSFFGKIRARTSLTLDLPTEAMWEYACRAGTMTALNNGKDLENTNSDPAMAEVGRYYYNTGDGKGDSPYTAKGGSYRANAWGLYDMHGNVAEWCLDWLQNDLGRSSAIDPTGPNEGQYRVIRGGSCIAGGSGIVYVGTAAACRSSYRSAYCGYSYNSYSRKYVSEPDCNNPAWGFRVCCFPAD